MKDGGRATDGERKTRRVPWATIATGISLAIALGSLALSKRADDRSAETEQELRQVNVEVVGATLPVFGQFVATPEIRAAVTVAISNASLRGVIVRDARLELDGRQVGCVVGWIDQHELPTLKLAASTPARVEDPLPLALPSRDVRNIALLFVMKPRGLYPQCVDSRRFRTLARRRLVALATKPGQRRLRLSLQLVPRLQVSVPINVVLCVPRFRQGPQSKPLKPLPGRVRMAEPRPERPGAPPIAEPAEAPPPIPEAADPTRAAPPAAAAERESSCA
jgi:hypothetical protein